MPQMPGMSATVFFAETMAQSQVEVPIALTKTPSWIPEPIAP